MKYLIVLVACILSGDIHTQINFDQKPIREATLRFIQSLSTDQNSICLRPWNDTNRVKWSNLPLEQVDRDGLRLDQLSDSQRILIHEMLRTILSEQGYQKALFIMQYDEDTHSRLATAKVPIAHRYGHEKYWTWIFGDPVANKVWALSLKAITYLSI